jgi:hypothetical protein
MTPRALYRAATTAVVTGVAGVALATPAAAMVDPAPPPNPDGTSMNGGATTTSTDDSPWAEIGAGLVAGVVLAGVGIAASVGMRRRSVTHPA